jgi:hypothetical protein
LENVIQEIKEDLALDPVQELANNDVGLDPDTIEPLAVVEA